MGRVAGAARSRSAGARLPWLLFAVLVGAGCQRSEAPAAAAEATPSAPAQPATAPIPWRTAELVAAHVGEGAAIAPVYEAVDDLRGEAMLVVAVARPGASSGTIERWRLQSGGPKAIYAPVGEGEGILRLDRADAPASERLDALRRFAATPGTAVIRPRGLADSPEALLDALARALREAQDPSTPADARARAIATMLRGLDDPLVFERDAIPAVIPVFAAGPPTIAVSRPVGARRHHLETAGAEPVALELTRLADGWVVSEVGPIAPSTDPPASPP